jgi:glutaminase
MFTKRTYTNAMLVATLIAASIVATLIATSFVPGSLSAQDRRSPVAPRKEQVQAVINEAYEKFKSDTSGKNADYISYLAQVDSKMFGISVVSTDNQNVSTGEIKYSFEVPDRMAILVDCGHGNREGGALGL